VATQVRLVDSFFKFSISVKIFFSQYSSGIGAELYDAGFLNITNIDISTVVINHMAQVYSSREEMECKFKKI
jgi:hypothetical protein